VSPTLPREGSILAFLLLLALTVRVVFVLQMRASPYFDHPALDQGFYVEAGRAVATGQEIRPGPIVRPPLYGWWLGLIFRIFGESLLVPRLLQCLVGTIAVWLVHRLAKVAFCAWTGLLAALLAATYWVLVYYDGELLRESLLNPLNLCGALWTLEFSRKSSWVKGTAAGLAWGLAALLRPQVLAVVPFFLLYFRFYSRMNLRYILGYAAAVAAPILPITTYNWVVGGDRLLISAEGGQALWIGNNPQSDGTGQVAPGTRGDFWGGYEDTRALAELEEGHPLRPSEVSSHYVWKTWTWISQQPMAATRLLLQKLRLLWTDWEFGSPEEPYFFASRFAPITSWLPLGFGIIASLAAMGLLSLAKRGFWESFPIWGFVLFYGLTIVTFIVGSRYRLPIIPFLLILAAEGLVWVTRATIAAKYSQLLSGIALMILVFAGTRTIPAPRDHSVAHGLTWLGIAEDRVEHRDNAVALFTQSLALSPSSCDTLVYLGVTLVALNRLDDARRNLERAVQLCPDDVQALDALTDLLLKIDRIKEARALSERSIKVAPHLARSRYNLGRTFVVSGQAYQAVAAFQAAVAIDPEYFNAAYALGMIDLDLGHKEDAIHALSQAVARRRDAVQPGFLFSAYSALIDNLVQIGRREEALKYAREMVTRLPANVEARHILERL